MTTATLRLACPPMKINRVARRLRRTASEPMAASLEIDSGTRNARIIDLGTVLIPETDVHKVGLGHWRVDACIGQSLLTGGPQRRSSEVGPYVVTELPPEDTLFDWDDQGPCFYAQPIDAPTTVTLPDGSVWTGRVTYPLCRIDLFTMTAEAVVAEGTLTKNP